MLTPFKDLLNEIKDKYVQQGGTPKSFIECFIQEILNAGDKESIFTGNTANCIWTSAFFKLSNLTISEQQLIMVMEDLFIGGSETTSITMRFSLV